MTINTELNTAWLVSVLSDLGSTGDGVADTLRKASDKGVPTDIQNDPIAVYIGSRTRDLVLPGTEVEVVVTADEVVVSVATSSSDPDDRHEVSASTPAAIEDFLDRFDADEDYSGLAVTPGT